MAKFKVGDKVMLKSGLRAGEKYNDKVFISGMSFVGVKTIDEVTPTGSYLIKKGNRSGFFILKRC